jgi:hypothetical protein
MDEFPQLYKNSRHKLGEIICKYLLRKIGLVQQNTEEQKESMTIKCYNKIKNICGNIYDSVVKRLSFDD